MEDVIPTDIEGVHITISGIQDEDEFLKNVVRKEVISYIEKIRKMTEIIYFTVHVKKADEEGKRARFSVNVRATTKLGELHADESEWDLPKAVAGALGKIEREVYKEEDREKFHM